MDPQVLFNIAASALVTVLSGALTYVYNKLERSTQSIADLRVKVAEDYIHKDRFVETVEQMMSLLQRIENKLDQKADKH